ncbi:transposase [Piscirickettsia salmonis]|uniref:transposase n=1 Tax=Piscirickettsia salmonis TaxID=1238 RepID=UPI003869BB22
MRHCMAFHLNDRRFLTHASLYYDGEKVAFRYIDRETGKQEKYHYTALEFIDRLIPHIPAKSFKQALITIEDINLFN